MIRVELRANGGEHGLFLQGHADYARAGEPDIVCAAASALVYALAGYLQSSGAEGLEVRLASGDARISCRGGREAFSMAEIGLRALARQYPENICVKAAVS